MTEFGPDAPQNLVERKEGIPVGKILIVDDKYSEELKQIFEGIHGKDTEKPEIISAKNYESIKQLIDSISDNRGVGVMSDLFFPVAETDPEEIEKGHYDQTEGLKIIKEILIHYGVEPEAIESMIEQYEALVMRHGVENVATSSVMARGRWKNEELAKVVESIFTTSMDDSKFPGLNDFMDKTFYVMDYEFLELARERVTELFDETGIKKALKDGYILKHEDGQYYFTRAGEIMYGQGAGVCTGKEFLSTVTMSLTNTKDGGIAMGVRVAEAAHQKGIPVTIITGAHFPSRFSFVIARYLYDKGVIRNPNAYFCPDGMVNRESYELNPGVQEKLNGYDFFAQSKFLPAEEDDRSKKQKMENQSILKGIAKSLEYKVGQVK